MPGPPPRNSILARIRFVRWFRGMKTEDALAHTITGLEIAKDAVTVANGVPYLVTIIGGVLSIAKSVEAVNGTKDNFVQVAKRGGELVEHVRKHIGEDTTAISEELEQSLKQLEATVASIKEKVRTALEHHFFVRYLRRASMDAIATECGRQLDDAWRSFDSACTISTNKGVVKIDLRLRTDPNRDPETKMRFLYYDQVVWGRVRGTYTVVNVCEGEEWDGKLDGRDVIVRTVVRRPSQPKFDFNSLALYNANVVSSADWLRSWGDRTRPWTASFMWKKLAFAFAAASKDFYIHSLVKGRAHTHKQCLPTAGLNDFGRLIIHAPDIVNANSDCFRRCLNRSYCEINQFAYKTDGGGWGISFPTGPASDLLAGLRAGANVASYVDAFIQSQLACFWSLAVLPATLDARVGEYGQLTEPSPGTNEARRFISLGHINELLGMEVPVLTRRCYGTRAGTHTPYETVSWPDAGDGALSHDCSAFAQGEDAAHNTVYIQRILDVSACRAFFWDYASSLRNSTMFQSTSLSSNGEPQKPWGFWSRDPSPTTSGVLVPDVEVDGVTPEVMQPLEYSILRPFEGLVVAELNRARGLGEADDAVRFSDPKKPVPVELQASPASLSLTQLHIMDSRGTSTSGSADPHPPSSLEILPHTFLLPRCNDKDGSNFSPIAERKAASSLSNLGLLYRVGTDCMGTH
ncbi:uncharacterized protein BXZ73DRAFT_78245 [Epithele typhae]|uniref:uncharacterized protein n=1 Tax=Epithele typhae TaxID=378194 RepID=UPI00200856F1|nr:uncharacterized protein BXZ73DRAFT_78245 [Epithele typhae]KAH9929108.1 hypothetical protein BXZ73DRAFT_78245 [Epithele typhae]